MRTGLTLLGISIGIAAVVALVGISHGFESGWEQGLKQRGTDVVVSNISTALTPKPFAAEMRDRVAKLPEVAATSELLVEITSIESSEMMMISSREWGAFGWQHLKVLSGRLPKDALEPVVVLGQIAAEVLKKKAGDKIQIETEELTVCGIVDGGAVVENGCVILSLELYQKLSGNEGKINVIDVRAVPNLSRDAMRQVCDKINEAIPGVKAMMVSEHLSTSQGYKVIHAMSWGTSSLAILVGVLGVMNTMLMTVFERKQELSILLALGWRRRRIVQMILSESALLGFFGGIVGVGLGALGVKLLQAAPAIRGLLSPEISPGLLLFSVGISIVVGVISGLYPAWRSSRVRPSEALNA